MALAPGACHFLQIKRLLIEICEDWTFLHNPRSVRATEPLERLKQGELMGRNYALLLRPPRRSAQALVSATSAGSRELLFFQEQWACPFPGGFFWFFLEGHRSMTWVFGPTPTHFTTLAAPSWFLHCDLHMAKVRGLACMREGAKCLLNTNQTLTE